MAKIVGPSGVVADVADEVASGLVSGGYAEYVKESKPVPSAKPVKESK